MGERTTSQIIENINKTVGISNTTKQRPLQGNVMAAISKRKHRYYENNCFANDKVTNTLFRFIKLPE